MTQPQPKTMELLRNRYCICSCCCAGQCRSECPWCTREIHCCACGTSPEDRENPCQPCSPDCRHLNCNPEEAERTERQMDQLLRKVLRLPESWDSHEGSKIQETVANEAKTILATAMRLELPMPWTAPGGDGGIGLQWETSNIELYIDIAPGQETTYVLNEGARTEEGTLTSANTPEVLKQLRATGQASPAPPDTARATFQEKIALLQKATRD